MSRIIVILIFLACGIITRANEEMFPTDKKLSHFVVENWTKEDGLPSNSLLNIIQTSDGYIWVSSYDGLIRFDGVAFTVFKNSNTPVFDANGIGALAEDSKGVLWMTTQNSGLISYKNRKFQSHKIKGKVEHLHRIIFVDNQDKIWSSTTTGRLFYYQDDSCTFVNDPMLPQNAIYADMIQDQSGAIWIATEGKGLFRLHKNTVENFTEKDGLISNWASSLSFDEDGNLWIGTDKGVSVYNGKNFRTVHALSGKTINNVIADRPNALWFSCNSGLIRMIKNTGEIEMLKEANGLASNHTIDMMFGFEHSLWVIHYKGGLSRIKNALFVTLTNGDNLKGSIVNTICEINADEILVGLNNGYINKISNNNITEFKPRRNIYGKRIRDIFQDSKKNLWIGTYAGLLKILPNGEEQWFAPSNGFPAKYIRIIYEDRYSQIWVGTRNNGLINITPDNNYRIIDKSKGMSNNLIMSIDEDEFGNLIVGTSKGGLHIIKNDTVQKIYTMQDGLISDIIFNTYTDEDDIMWIAVKGGLNWIRDGEIYGVKTNPFVLPFSPYDILQDDNNYFWIPGSDGVIKVKKSTILEYATEPFQAKRCRVFGTQDGIKQPECTSTSSSLKTSNGHFWFPTIEGVAVVNPEKKFDNTYVPPVYIEKIIADGQPIAMENNMQFSAGTDRIVFHYTALSYYYPQRVQFKYKLNGYNDSWSSPDYKREISFTNLPPGDYTFHVIACNNNDVWNEAGEKLNFTIEPFWYQTRWVFVLISITLIALVYLAYRLRVSQIKRRQAMLKELVRKRTAEIAEKNRKIQSRNEEILQVTEEIQSQNEEIKAINEELEKLSVVASETDNAIRIIDSRGRIEWINDAFTKLYEYSLSEIIANEEANLISGKSSPEAREAINKCLNDKVTVIYTEQRKTKAGKEIWVQTTLSPILEHNKEIRKLVAIDSDVTKLKKAEEKIRKQKLELEKYRNELEETVDERTRELLIAKEKAEESDKLKTAFLTNMSHEIRTPMNAIVGFADLLNMGGVDSSELKDYVQEINENSEVLLHLIDDIVEVSRLESSNLEINKKEHNLNDLLLELYKEYQLKTEGRTNLDIKISLEKETEITIQTDKPRLQQALQYLLNNALKYTEEGEVELGYILSDKNHVRVYVKDTGIGIKEEDIPVIFERFRKIEDHTVKLYRGAGLGLYITNSVVQALGGKIDVKSALGKGSTFIIELPLQ